MDPLQQYLSDVLTAEAANDDGAVADYIPELGEVDPDRLALSVVGPRGRIVSTGDAGTEFTIQSVSKPFVFAAALEERGRDDVLRHVGVEPSGEPFNAISLEPETGRPANPLINAGAIATTALIDAPSAEGRSARIIEWLSAFAGRSLWVDEAVYASESRTGDRNRALAHLLRASGVIDAPIEDVVEPYFRQCSVLVTVRDLAVMAATLAFGGRNPVTGRQVISERTARDVVSVMTSCGMYDGSGNWLLRVGLPAKSGVSGALIAVAPSQFGVGVLSPRLDAQGNSVRGQRVLERLSDTLGLHLLDPHDALAEPPVRVERDGDRVVIRVGGELNVSGAERVVAVLEDLGLSASDDLVIDLRDLHRAHPLATDALRRRLEQLGGKVRVEV